MSLGINQTKYGIWVGRGNEFYNKSMKSWLQDNNIKMHSANNEGKFIVAERFIRTLKNQRKKKYQKMLKLADQMIQLINATTYHSTIKMKSVDIKSSTYIDFNKENNKEEPKFKVGDHVRISKYKILFQKVTF